MGGCVVLGGPGSISFIDPRCASPIAVITRTDTSLSGSTRACQEVRSLSFRGHIVTAGSGNGLLSFYDVRRDFGSVKASLCDSKIVETRLSNPGWETAIQLSSPDSDSHVLPAIFSHAYNPSGSMLFTGGGGIEQGCYSSYAALWDTSSGLQVQAARDAEAARQTRAPELARAGGR